MARSAELTIGRTFGLVLDHGDDFFNSLERFCAENGLRSGYLPGFLGAFRQARLVGTCGPVEDPEAPVWDDVTVECVEVVGTGTIAWDLESNSFAPHIHVATGLKTESAHGRTSHLLEAEVQFVNEIIVVEVVKPTFARPRQADLYDVPLLTFE
jgi:predicted DNA-binding protein with PD1-like motif